MNDYEIVETNAGSIDGFGLCGNKDARNLGLCRKRQWLKDRYAEGLRYKVLRCEGFGDVGMIEYAPAEQTWRPVEADGYLVIHCLWVINKHKGKGLGRGLLDSCLAEAKKSRRRGVAVVTSSDSFMAENDLFLKAGFISVDRFIGRSEASEAPYELLVRKLQRTAPDPRFMVEPERLLKRYKKGLTILAADQCQAVSEHHDRGCRIIPSTMRMIATGVRRFASRLWGRSPQALGIDNVIPTGSSPEVGRNFTGLAWHTYFWYG